MKTAFASEQRDDYLALASGVGVGYRRDVGTLRGHGMEVVAAPGREPWAIAADHAART